MVKLSLAEWKKYDWRKDVFLKKYKANEEFQLFNGRKVTFRFSEENERLVKKEKYSEVSLLSTDGRTYKMFDLGKTSEFGGKGERSGTLREDRELASLKHQIDDIKQKDASSTIKIKVGNKIYDVFTAETTPGTPKSDFHLLDINGKEIVWISHKDGRGPKDFQQWGGISQRSEPKIWAHEEVQKFVTDLKIEYPKGLPSATSIFRKIKDTNLKMLSVYGNEFISKKLGRQNVSILLQGSIKLIAKQNNVYEFSAKHVHFNGDSVDSGGFEPVLSAIYKGDRSDAGVKGTRIVIMPINGRNFKKQI